MTNELEKFKYLLMKKYADSIVFDITIAFSNYYETLFYLFRVNNHPRTNDIVIYMGNIVNDLRARIKNVIIKSFKKNIGEFKEKQIKLIQQKILIKIIQEFIPFYNWISNSINNEIYPAYKETINNIKKWYNNFKLEEYYKLNIVNEYIDDLNIYKRQYYINKKEFLKYSTSSINLGEEFYDFEIYFLEKNVNSIFDGNLMLKPNDYIDQYLPNHFMKSKAKFFITFDEALIKVMKKSKEEKIINSINKIREIMNE